MASDDSEYIEGLAKTASKYQTGPKARIIRENTPVTMATRGLIRRTPPEHVRSLQFGMRITPRQKQRFTAYAISHGMSVTEFLIRAADHYITSNR